MILGILLWAACTGTPDEPRPADDGPAPSPARPADRDADGLSDAEEARLGTDPLDPDSDDDGFPDGAEMKHGTDPNDPESNQAGGSGGGDRLPGAGAPEPPEALRCTFALEDLDTCYVRVPGGTFTMGAQAADPTAPHHDPAALPDEGPPHRVQMSPYWIQRDEVTVSAFAGCVQAGTCRAEDAATGGFSTWTGDPSVRSLAPITSISWDGAKRLCFFLGGRLPTEAEWAFAARGPEGRRFPWGEAPGCGVLAEAGFDDAGQRRAERTMQRDTCTNDGPRSARELVGESPFRLRGMAGNVWEWVADLYAPDAYAAHARVDPTGPRNGATRVQRGGGWTSTDPLELRSAARMSMPPDEQAIDVGVRCVWGDP